MSSEEIDKTNTDVPTDASLVTKSSIDYKAKLDQAALKAHHHAVEEEEKKNKHGETLIDKVTQYVPALGKMLGHEKHESKPEESSTAAAGPPDRPANDAQIEEFLRDQHRSMSGENLE